MREAVGSTFLFKLMIIFIFFFASFLAIAINYSQAFRIKNQVINLIEQYEGLNDSSKGKIFNLINGSGYYRQVTCNFAENGEAVEYNSTTINGLCVRKQTTGTSGTDVYYKVTTFVSFNLPVIGDLITLPVVGETKVITNDAG